MRPIVLRVGDYDPVVQEEWSQDNPALLLTPHIVMSVVPECINFYYYKRPIDADVEVIENYRCDAYEDVPLDASKIVHIPLEALAKMTIMELAKILFEKGN